MNRWRWALLIFELFLLALIPALAQVDLPDSTFYGRSAPLVAKLRLFSTSSLSAITPHLQTKVPQLFRESGGRLTSPAIAPNLYSLLLLSCTLLC